MEALECIKTRRSVRTYQDTPVERAVIEDIVDCGKLAATARNIQPWMFLVLTQKDTIGRVAAMTDHGKFLASAPCCIAVFCEKVRYYLEDGCAATQNILLAAKAHGLGACWIAGDKKPYCSDIAGLLGVPDDYTLVSLCAIGYSATVPHPEKKPLQQVMRWERYSP